MSSRQLLAAVLSTSPVWNSKLETACQATWHSTRAVQTERRAVVLKMFNLVFKMFNVGDNLEINSLFIIPRSEAFKNAS